VREVFKDLFRFKNSTAEAPEPEDPYLKDKAAARITLDFSDSPYRVRLDDRLDALLSQAFEKRELEKAAGIQAVRDFLRRDIEEARRMFDE
jgi:hypothetical protein